MRTKVAFRDARDRVQRGNEAARWIEEVERTPRVATVIKSGYGDRELRVAYDAALVTAIKRCGNRNRWAAWDRDRRCWTVTSSLWPCVSEALVAHGYEIREG